MFYKLVMLLVFVSFLIFLRNTQVVEDTRCSLIGRSKKLHQRQQIMTGIAISGHSTVVHYYLKYHDGSNHPTYVDKSFLPVLLQQYIVTP